MPRGMFAGRSVHFYSIKLPKNIAEVCGREIKDWDKVELSGREPAWSSHLALVNYLSRYIRRNNAWIVSSLLSQSEGGLEKYVVEEKKVLIIDDI